MVEKEYLRTPFLCAIIRVIAHLSPSRIALKPFPKSRLRRPAHDHRRRPAIVPRESASLPALQAADQGVASSLEAVLSDNTRRTYDTRWRIFDDWCAEMGLRSLPAEPLTVARYLAARAGSGASIATLRLADTIRPASHTHTTPGARARATVRTGAC